ncbi:ornithine cyclodeaminase family protein [Siminovitchia sediminis]|uniref:Ornithine cyclodeaminase family protein n=1 Tax=Siminovitchia sediminis TaxID=1274353 RepID=A0ABW4KFK4_9BACI
MIINYHHILYLSQGDIESIDLNMSEAINITAETFVEHGLDKVIMPDKTSIDVEGNKFFHSMPAMVQAKDSVGVKWVSYYPGNKISNHVPDASCIIILNDTSTGLPLCIMEGLYITYIRTAAAAAVTAKKLGNPHAKSLGIIGAGELSRWSLKAILSAVPSIKQVRVKSRTTQSRDKFCDEMQELYKEVEFIKDESMELLVSESDIVVSTTPQPLTPFLEFDWLKKGGLALPLDMIAAWKIDCLEKADHVVTDDKRFLSELISQKYGNVPAERQFIEFGEVMKNEEPMWSNEKKIIAFMNGVGSTDVTVGKYIYDKAKNENIGTVLPLLGNRSDAVVLKH